LEDARGEESKWRVTLAKGYNIDCRGQYIGEDGTKDNLRYFR
jgi:hypothetical protein